MLFRSCANFANGSQVAGRAGLGAGWGEEGEEEEEEDEEEGSPGALDAVQESAAAAGRSRARARAGRAPGRTALSLAAQDGARLAPLPARRANRRDRASLPPRRRRRRRRLRGGTEPGPRGIGAAELLLPGSTQRRAKLRADAASAGPQPRTVGSAPAGGGSAAGVSRAPASRNRLRGPGKAAQPCAPQPSPSGRPAKLWRKRGRNGAWEREFPAQGKLHAGTRSP